MPESGNHPVDSLRRRFRALRVEHVGAGQALARKGLVPAAPGLAHAGRREDFAPEPAGERLAALGSDDLAGQHIAGVGIDEGLARRVLRAAGEREFDDPLRRPVVGRALGHGRLVFGQAAAVAEQVADANLARARQLREPSFDGLIQTQAPLPHQRENGDRRPGLPGAGGPEQVVRGERRAGRAVGPAGGEGQELPPRLDEGQ